jgi:hypothetical protein
VPLTLAAQSGSIRGRVTNDVSGLPVTGVTISYGTKMTQTRENGEYVLSGLAAGRDSLRARLIGYNPAAQLVTVAAGQTVTVDLTISALAVALS